jgi:acetolactate synthase-1/2/3 large subunit
VPIHADIKMVIDDLIETEDEFYSDQSQWISYCNELRERYPIYQEKFNIGHDGQVNPYYLGKELKAHLKDDSVIVLGNSTIAAHILQLGVEKDKQRIINNMNCGSMGYDLPAAIGAAVGTKDVITLITGDGSIMLNLQELMTARHYNLPIKIFIGCNGGYRGVVRSQSNMFDGRYIGCTPDTGVGIPDFKKVAEAFDIEYIKIEDQEDLNRKLNYIYSNNDLMMIEWPQDPEQYIEPRVMNRRDENGTIVSTDIDDLSPFLSRDEYESMKYSNWVKNR